MWWGHFCTFKRILLVLIQCTVTCPGSVFVPPTSADTLLAHVCTHFMHFDLITQQSMKNQRSLNIVRHVIITFGVMAHGKTDLDSNVLGVVK